MKFLTIFLLSALVMASSGWGTNFEEAKKVAKKEHKFVILNFSGSDWCGPCIRLRKEIFESSDFTQLSDEKLVLVNADFPRQKKNQLDKELQKSNDKLADKYNPNGIFPLTLLLTAEGKLVKEWEGYPEKGKDNFILEIHNAVNAIN